MASTTSVPRVARALAMGALLLAAVSAFFVLWWALGTRTARPLDGVEGEVAYEASRIVRALPLYFDPVQGTIDEGRPAARFYVLYPPLFPALLSLLGSPDGLRLAEGARIVSFLAFIGAITSVIAAAPSKANKVAGGIVALYIAGTFTLALYWSAGRPDTLALCLALLAFARTLRKGGVDAVAGVLFALAAWTKPNVVGLGMGVFIAEICRRRRGAWVGFAGLLGVSVVLALILHRVSGGAFLGHLRSSTGQSLGFARFVENVPPRLQLFGVPIVLALAHSFVSRVTWTSGWLAVAGVGGATAWSLLCFAKVGAAANYWIEPLFGVLAIACIAPVPTGRGATVTAGVALVQVIWGAGSSVPGAIRARYEVSERAAFFSSARASCGAKEGEVVIADEPGFELMLNGRVIDTPFQFSHLLRRGSFPLSAWSDSLLDANVACLVVDGPLLERDLSEVDAAHDRYAPEVRALLRDRFERTEVRGGFFLYRRKAK